jgi:cobalt-zinc-cadmium efflux system outer membrane protein
MVTGRIPGCFPRRTPLSPRHPDRCGAGIAALVAALTLPALALAVEGGAEKPHTLGAVQGAAGAGAAAPAEARALTLEECLVAAAEHSPASLAERARLAQARADVTVARAALLPRVSGSAYAVELNDDRLSPALGAPAGATAELYAQEAFAGLRGKWVLFDGLRGWNAHAAARRGVEAGRSGVALVAADVRLAVTQAFYRLLAAQELTAVADGALGRQRAFEELAVAFADAGRGSRVDPLRARAQRLDAERALVAAREAEAVAGAQLRRAIGLETSGRLRGRGAFPEPVPPPDAVAEAALVERVLRSSADLRRLDAQVAQARATARAGQGTWFPELSAQGGYGWRARDVGGNAVEWTAGVYAEWPLLEGGAGKGALDKAAARARELEATRRALALAVEADLQEALAAWRSAFAAAASTIESAEATRAALEATTALYRTGRSSALDALTAQVELARAEAARTLAYADAAVARARVERLAGDGGG